MKADNADKEKKKKIYARALFLRARQLGRDLSTLLGWAGASARCGDPKTRSSQRNQHWGCQVRCGLSCRENAQGIMMITGRQATKPAITKGLIGGRSVAFYKIR